ncbi:MAG: PEP/pyruvate-binding domain-containing protein [Flavobacteriales bacterium]
MKSKSSIYQTHVIIGLFACILMLLTIIVKDSCPQSELSVDEKWFDLEQNDELSDAEKHLMFRVMRLEAPRGNKFSAQQVRERQSGQQARSRRRHGFGRLRGSREPSLPRLNPDQIAFKDGAATIPDRETFEKLSYQGTDVRVDPQLAGIEFVKFQIERTHTQNPQLYFMNTETHRSHESFMSAAGLGRGPGQMRGVLSYRPLSMAPNGTPGVYTFEFNPTDAFPFEEIKLAHDLLVAEMSILENRLGYCPLWGAIDIYYHEKALYDAAEFPVYFEDDLYANISYLPLNQARSFGRLRILEVGERPSPRDIVICKTLPNEMSRIAGVITGARQTPLSHVNLRAVQDKVPNAFIAKAWENKEIAPLIGRYVYYEVNADGFEIREATFKEVEKYFTDLRPSKTQKPARDLSVTKVLPLDGIGFADAASFGVKTANMATLRTLGFPEGTVPNGFGVPLYFYDAFMKHNGFYAEAEALIKDSEFQDNYGAKEADLKRFRERIKKAEMPTWMMDAISELHNAFPEGTSLRCRSSTNNEDLPRFSGTGLYDSYTHHPDEGHLSKSIKQVFASLWNFRAFEAREFHHIDHFATGMGILVHPNFANELANGVAVTDDVVYQTIGNYYLNIQVGENLVTHPEGQSIPEEILLDWWDSGNYRVVTTSNQTTDNERILTDVYLRELRGYLAAIHNKFSQLYGTAAQTADFAMEIEFKITSAGKLAIKQARPCVR